MRIKRSICKHLLWAAISTLSASTGFGQYAISKVANIRTPVAEKTQRLNNTPKAVTVPTPPMGWNSWNNFGCDITEKEFLAQVDYAATHLKAAGYEYMVIDISWYSPNVSADPQSPYHHPSFSRHDAELDNYGRLLPAKNKFPSANGSFKYLADYVHSKGLKLGIHIMRGIPWQAVERDLPIIGTAYRARDIANPADICDWYNATYGVDMSKPGAQEYYNSIFKLYASWNVDFVKVDDLSMPYRADEVTAIRKAIAQSGREMVFSTSPGSTPVTARYHVLTNADMFRVSADFWDSWPRLKEQFGHAKTWAVHAGDFPGHWPDLDMIPFGKIATRSGDAGGERFSQFTPDEQITLMTLWCIARSPLIIGNDLTQTDEATLKRLTNAEVIAVNQRGEKPKEVFSENGMVIWSSDTKDGLSKNVALFNQTENEQTLTFLFSQLGLNGKYKVRDLWSRKDLGEFEGKFQQVIPRHGAGLYKITRVE